jgi:cell wall-associated NlpC family hydrolase
MKTLTLKQRYAIVAEAKTWIGTPYRGWSHLKHYGVDCGQLLAGVFMATGHVPKNIRLPKDYSLQVAEHKASTEYVDIVGQYMREIAETEVLPGDVVVFKLGLAYAHAAIIVKWSEIIIHAIAHRGVTTAHGRNFPLFRHCEKKFFTLREAFI